jgi:hypothetical protein
VTLHHQPFLPGERLGLEQDSIRNPYFAQIMEGGETVEVLAEVGGERSLRFQL